MYNFVIRADSVITAALAAAFMLTSCAEEPAVRTHTAEYETEDMIILAEWAEFSGFSAELEAYLNDKYSCDLQSITKRIEESDKRELAANAKYSYENKLDVIQNDNGIMSLLNSEYIYTGGAHGTLTRTAENINVTTGEILTLKSLFIDDTYRDVLERKINELITKYPEEYSELWEKPTVGDEEEYNFYIEENKLVIYYQPYELSYYARGVVEFPIAMSELDGWLKEELLPKPASGVISG